MIVVADRDQQITSSTVSYILYPTPAESALVSDKGYGGGYRIADPEAYYTVAGALTRLPFTPYRVGHRIWSSGARTDAMSLVVPRREATAGEPTVRLPAWFARAVGSLIALRLLPTNWDSYGGAPLEDVHARAAIQFLHAVMTDYLPLPDFIPLADGGVELEWDVGDRQLAFTSESGYAPTITLTTPTESREIGAQDLPEAMKLLRSLTATLDGA
jgi:hypothetical protein